LSKNRERYPHFALTDSRTAVSAKSRGDQPPPSPLFTSL
jgi:hypothetical protein